ncbi:MAG: hypothetical protein ACM31H_06440, partial [Nitrososphaerales archaeon]
LTTEEIKDQDIAFDLVKEDGKIWAVMFQAALSNVQEIDFDLQIEYFAFDDEDAEEIENTSKLNIDIDLMYRENKENIRGYKIKFTGNFINDMASVFAKAKRLNDLHKPCYKFAGIYNVNVRIQGSLKFQFDTIGGLINNCYEILDIFNGFKPAPELKRGK